MTADLEIILQRATSGLALDEGRIFRPSWFYSMLRDSFWIWCHYHAPDCERVDETTLYDRHRMQQGNVWEGRYVAENFPAAYEVESRWGLEAVRETIGAMLAGESIIHGGALWLLGEDVYGKADVLVRCDGHASDLGDFHYRVKEVKNSSEVKKHHRLQAAVYTWVLGELQGYRPESFDIVLREGAGEHTIAYEAAADSMHESLATWREIRDGHMHPEPRGYDSTSSPWRQYANRILSERNDIALLPDVGPATAINLRRRGFPTTDEILALGADRCAAEFRRDHHYYHALALREGRPVFRPGESPFILRRERLVYFDVEDTSTLDGAIVTRPHIYMLGAATPDGETQIFTARGEDDEVRMWTDFLDWLGDPADVALYCWTMYEAGKMRQAAADHPDLEARLGAAEAALIDLKAQVKCRPFFPVTSYSIKAVAPVCGFDWGQGDVDGMSAQVLYLDWLRSGDDAIIAKVEQYNREDVLAMLAVDRYVTAMGDCDPLE
ncbi:MAG: TM0106 family RecB-like putative nuclease [Deltaproteobacteria bacterium]|nr:TM0106 family RecB-like putative nuclease [Deltaproteobacteria bacterium]